MLKSQVSSLQSDEELPIALNQLPDGKSLSDEELCILNQMNKNFAHVKVGGAHKVISLEQAQPDLVNYCFESPRDFKHNFNHLPKVAGLNRGEVWFSWPGKVFKPGGLGFYPQIKRCPENVYNLFLGLRVKPLTSGDCEPYLHHLKAVLCNNNDRAFNYLVGWLAHLFQRPDEKPSVAILLRSVEGTGKGTMVKPLLTILGLHGVQVNGAYQLTGRFNGTLANKLLAFADEVDLTDPRTADKLKGLISESVINLERKGMEAEPIPNYCRFIFASNHEQVLNAGSKERRYLVLEPNPAFAQDADYFDKLYRWLSDEGAAKLLGYLLRYDLSDFSPYAAPITQGLIQQKLTSLVPVDQFFYSQLLNERPFDGLARIGATELVERFVQWMSQQKDSTLTLAQARSLIGKAMVRLEFPAQGRSDRPGGKYYELPDFSIMRQRFAHTLGATVEETF